MRKTKTKCSGRLGDRRDKKIRGYDDIFTKDKNTAEHLGTMIILMLKTSDATISLFICTGFIPSVSQIRALQEFIRSSCSTTGDQEKVQMHT